VSTRYDTNIVQKLNVAGRAGKYGEALWKDSTGKTVQELGDEWKAFHEQKLTATQKKDASEDEQKKPTPQ